MPSNTSNNGNKKDNSDDMTVKDVSSKLDISEATVKKYIKDFGLDIGKGLGNKAVISEETFQALTEIVKLRANGLSIQEIKELKAQKPSKNILDEIEETVVTAKSDVAESSCDAIKTADSVSDVASPVGIDELNGDLLEDGKAGDEDESVALEDKVSDEGEDEEQEQGQERRKRRGFNYRYVERQIANDSKRVYSLRQRIKNPNISVRDRLFFEEALERRILFLNGWKHILRWISK